MMTDSDEWDADRAVEKALQILRQLNEKQKREDGR